MPEVIAHVITVPDDADMADVHKILKRWQDQTGVPAVIFGGGVRLVGSLLADGELVQLPLDDDLTARVQLLLAPPADNETEAQS